MHPLAVNDLAVFCPRMRETKHHKGHGNEYLNSLKGHPNCSCCLLASQRTDSSTHGTAICDAMQSGCLPVHHMQPSPQRHDHKETCSFIVRSGGNVTAGRAGTSMLSVFILSTAECIQLTSLKNAQEETKTIYCCSSVIVQSEISNERRGTWGEETRT